MITSPPPLGIPYRTVPSPLIFYPLPPFLTSPCISLDTSISTPPPYPLYIYKQDLGGVGFKRDYGGERGVGLFVTIRVFHFFTYIV